MDAEYKLFMKWKKERDKQKQKEEALERSVKLNAMGFITGAAMALEQQKSVEDVIRYGIAGTLTTLFFEVAFPKASNFVKSLM